MIGFPRILSTKEDFYNLKDLYLKEVKEYLKNLMDNRFIWIEDKELAPNQPHVFNDTVKVIETSKDGKEIFMQMKLVEDTNAEFFKLGWTVAEANEFLNYVKEGK